MKFNKEIFIKNYNLEETLKVTEKNYQGIKYISWANAYKMLLEQDENATYEVLEDENGFPCFSRGESHFVKTSVTAFGLTKKMFLPVMDNKFKAVPNPNSRQIGDAIMRCLAKNISMFGIGLSFYTGEDIQHVIEENKRIMAAVESIIKLTDEYTKETLKNKSLEDLKKIYMEVKK